MPHEDELRGRGVAYCATCDGMLYRGKTVVVVGGGNSAAEDALFLSRVCKRCIWCTGCRAHRLQSYWTALQKAENVEFIWNSRVVELLYGSVVTGVVLEGVESGNRSELACDGVFIAVGRIPNTGLFHGVLEMDAAGYLIADETTRKALPGVFAVGDVRTKPLRQIITAAADGAVASKYAEAYLAEQED
ncbi:MAG: NAD(P)/FAD-dependent oxidoreductase [Ruthenibacterium lactatiformans]